MNKINSKNICHSYSKKKLAWTETVKRSAYYFIERNVNSNQIINKMVCITRQKYIPIIIGSFPYSILVFFIHLYSLLKKFDYFKVTIYLANLATDKKKCLVGIFVLNDLKKSNIFNNTFNIFRNREITTHFALQPE